MKLLSISLPAALRWGIRPSDPKTFELNCVPGWCLVNPFLYAPIDRQLGHKLNTPASRPTFIADDIFIINSQGLILEAPDGTPFSWQDAFPEWDIKLYQLLRYFRYASKQFSISANIKSFGPMEIDELPDPAFPEIGDRCTTLRWHLTTAIDRSDVEVVSKQDLRQPPPAYDTMLLDAIEAVTHEDYKTAVLFSGISMETLIRTKLSEAFALSFEAGSATEPLSVVFRPESDTQNIEKRKEKLHKLLVTGPGFAQLIDTSCFILLGRSLKLENKDLYDRAIKVYQGRNDIAHHGMLPVLSEEDVSRWSGFRPARDALKCAIELVDWLGELGGYANPLDPRESHITCNSPKVPGDMSSDHSLKYIE